MSKWQHCKLQGNQVAYLGAAGVFDNKRDTRITERIAFGKLEDEGWELVTVLPATEPVGEFVYFFKRLVPEGL